MKTKAEILGRLLKKKQIDEEELVILLMAEKQIQYVPYPVYPQPYWPQYPYSPIYSMFNNISTGNRFVLTKTDNYDGTFTFKCD